MNASNGKPTILLKVWEKFKGEIKREDLTVKAEYLPFTGQSILSLLTPNYSQLLSGFLHEAPEVISDLLSPPAPLLVAANLQETRVSAKRKEVPDELPKAKELRPGY